MVFVSGILLAAGLSKRMGRQKLLLPFHGRPLLVCSLNNLVNSKVDEIIVVLENGSDTDKAVQAYLEPLRVERPLKIVKNEHSGRGLSSSMKLGISRASEKSDGFLFVLGDMPFIIPGIIDRTIDFFDSNPGYNTVPLYAGTPGHPVLIMQTWRDRLLGVEGDTGGRVLLHQYPEANRYIEFETSLPLTDIDTPGDYEQRAQFARYLPGSRLIDYLGEDSRRCISISGGGGKTSLLVYLSQELKKRGRRVLMSTTTHLSSPVGTDYGYDTVFRGMTWDFPEDEILPNSLVFWYGGYSAKGKTVRGPHPAEIEKVYRKTVFDNIMLETDGSAGRPVKFPGAHEPAMPLFADTSIYVIGLSGFGTPADESTVHRIEFFKKYISEKPGTIDAETLVRIIDHPQGAFKQSPAGSRKIVVLNQCDMIPVEERQRLKEYLLRNATVPEAFVFTRMKPSPEVIDVTIRGYTTEDEILYSTS